jgi:halimadienyl-diphosphate synthase
MSLEMDDFRSLLRKMGPGLMSSTAYDTAWIARLINIEPAMANSSIQWICENQLPDGSWGASTPMYYHDRVICTLAAMTVLVQRGRRVQDRVQVEKGLAALEKITSGATRGLQADPNGATIGFEMIAPTLVAEAEKLGIIKQQSDRILGRLRLQRAAKMEKLAGQKINRMVTPAFSAEMAGLDGQNLLDIDNLQEANGSVAHSPSATAYLAIQLKPGDAKALAYLHKWIQPDGGMPNVDPFDVFEPAWILWNLRLLRTIDAETLELCKPHLDLLEDHWDPKGGIAHALDYTPKDSDDSAVTFELLKGFGRNVDINGILNYEEREYFRCFALEANPSISANIHVLGALKQAGYEQSHPSVQKILKFLHTTRTENNYWFDKWHASPYYPTSHASILLCDYDKQMCQNAIEWIIKSQNANGSWGYYQETAEETAYAMQALCVWKRSGGKIPTGRVAQGLFWLTEHSENPYPSLWIGKALYCPRLVVRSTILSAIQLAKEII